MCICESMHVCVCVFAWSICVPCNAQLGWYYYYRLDEMKSEQAKLQGQLKEFEKKQADYEEVGLDHNSASHDLLV